MSRSTRALGARSVAASAALLVLAAGLAGCGSSSPTTPASTTGATAAKSPAAAAGPVTLVNGWVRSKDAMATTATGMAGDMSMTGIFGMLTNTTDKEITVTGGSSPVAGLVEVHETVKNAAGVMVMQPKAGGFVIPAKAPSSSSRAATTSCS